MHSVVNKIKSQNMTAVFTALEGDTKSELLKEIGMFVDDVIHVEWIISLENFIYILPILGIICLKKTI